MYVCMYVSMFVYVCMYVRMYVCMYVSMYVCIYVFYYARMYAYIYVRMYKLTHVPTNVCMFGLCIQASQINETKKITAFKHLWGRGYGALNTNMRYFVRRLTFRSQRHVTPPQTTDVTAGV
jgi:hypothetical protein